MRRSVFLCSLMGVLAACSSYGEAPQDQTAPAAVVTAGGTTPGCSSTDSYRFCDDFDKQPTIDAKSWQIATVGGDVSVDENEPCSAPSSLLSTLPAQTVDPKATVAPGAVVWKQFVLTSAKAHIELDMRLDVDLAKIQSDTNLVSVALPTNESAIILIGSGKVWVTVGGKSTTFTRAIELNPFPLGRWTHVVLELVFDQKEGSVFVSSDGKVLADTKSLQTAGTGSQLDSFWMGAGVAGWPETDVRLKLDDIKVY